MFLMFFHQYLMVRKGNVCCDLKYSFFMIVGKVSDFIDRRKVFGRVKICYNW